MGKLKGAVAAIPKNKLLEGTVLEILGGKMSVRLANNGRTLVGISYLGGPCSTGSRVRVDYSSGQPVAYAIGEEYKPTVIQKTITNPVKGSTSEATRRPTAEHSFLSHTDVPGDYTGQAGKVAAVKATEDGLEFARVENTGAMNAIVLHDLDAGTLVRYAASDAGLDSASAAAAAGDTIYLPAVTLTQDHILKGGVTYLGQYLKSVTFTGKITLETDARLYNATVTRTANDANELVAIQGPASGGAVVDYCIVWAIQDGAGNAYAINLESTSGIVYVPRASLVARSQGGNGYAVYCGPSNTCDIRLYWSVLEGSTQVANTDAHVYTYGCVYETPNTHGTTMEGDGGSGGGGAGDILFWVDGALAAMPEAGGYYVSPRAQQIFNVRIYLDDTGSSGATVVDINKNGTSILASPESIAANGMAHTVSITPYSMSLTEGDVLTVDVDSVASGARGLAVVVACDPGAIDQFGLNDLSDVAITAPSANQVLRYDGAQWINGSLGGVKARFAAKLSGDHTPVNNTWGLVPLANEFFDEGGYYNNSAGNYKWTPPTGTVIITLAAEWNNTNANGQSIGIYKNGAAAQTVTHRIASTYNDGHQIVLIDYASGTDYYQAYAWRYDGSAVVKNTAGTRFSGVCL